MALVPKCLYAACVFFVNNNPKLGELFYGYSRNLLAIDEKCTKRQKVVLFG